MIKLPIKRLARFCRKMATSSSDPQQFRFQFDNRALRELPIDSIKENYVRSVSGACFSRVTPEPLKNPVLVCHSKEALALLDIDDADNLVETEQFIEYFSGNKILPGAEPAAHCYCGHQFGVFAGQLGDGAAMYLGEILNKDGKRWELQFKGAGPTPYSRSADGRKVLRSSIREFLCSEAMWALGIPTTRAGTCITSDSRVERDVFYTGHPIMERCTIITRLAETFIRFGSFEIFKTMDPSSGRRGPSLGRNDILFQLANYTVRTFFPEIWKKYEAEKAVEPESEKDEGSSEVKIDRRPEQMYLDWYREVVTRTAQLVAKWQAVGFCHGVLNTDNMSITGLTIDYGPFGFLERYDPDHICNASDDHGRYTYVKQPSICKWNCMKLAEALAPIVPKERTGEILNEVYDSEFNRAYLKLMRSKFGLFDELNKTIEDWNGTKVLSDQELTDSFFDTMQRTGADFTNSFRALSSVSLPGMIEFETDLTQLEERLLKYCTSLSELLKAEEAAIDTKQVQLVLMLLHSNPGILTQLGFTEDGLRRMLGKVEQLSELKKQTDSVKSETDKKQWNEWIGYYKNRLHYEIRDLEMDQDVLFEKNSERVRIMNGANPKYVLRNYLAHQAIKKAEEGDYSEVRRLHQVLKNPFEEQDIPELEQTERAGYEGQKPEWACTLKVGCSS